MKEPIDIEAHTRAGISMRVSPHLFRHTFASHLLLAGYAWNLSCHYGFGLASRMPFDLVKLKAYERHYEGGDNHCSDV